MQLIYGTVQAVDPKSAQVRVLFSARDNMLSPWLPVIAARAGDDAQYWLPDVHEQVACILDDTLESGAVLGSVFSTSAPPPSVDGEVREIRFKDGTMVRYDRGTRRLDVSCAGDVTIHAAGNLTLTADGNVRVSGTRVDFN